MRADILTSNTWEGLFTGCGRYKETNPTEMLLSIEHNFRCDYGIAWTHPGYLDQRKGGKAPRVFLIFYWIIIVSLRRILSMVIWNFVLPWNPILLGCISLQTARLVRLGKAFDNPRKRRKLICLWIFLKITSNQPTKDAADILSTYTKSFEQGWREKRPNISGW